MWSHVRTIVSWLLGLQVVYIYVSTYVHNYVHTYIPNINTVVVKICGQALKRMKKVKRYVWNGGQVLCRYAVDHIKIWNWWLRQQKMFYCLSNQYQIFQCDEQHSCENESQESSKNLVSQRSSGVHKGLVGQDSTC